MSQPQEYQAMQETDSSDQSNEEDDGVETDPEDMGFIRKLMDPHPDNKCKDYFQMTTACVILLCTLAMAIETDYPNWAIWRPWDTLVLLYFIFELAVRMIYQKAEFFSCSGENKECFWNYFDFLIVLVCIFDLWAEPLIDRCAPDKPDCDSGLGILKIFRIFRILRTLRVLRIFRACTRLNNLVVGLLESISSVFWILVLMLMFMLIFAIVLTDVAGNQAKRAEKPGDLFFKNKEEIIEYWGSVGKSMVTSFQFLTLDNWTEISRQIYDELPAMWFVFALYIFLMGFSMLSLLTGVVADHMEDVSIETKEEDKKDGDNELKKFLDEEMPNLERHVSRDTYSPTGELVRHDMTHAEFETFLELPKVKGKLQELDVALLDHEVNEFWNCLDRNGDGQLTHDELKSGFLRLRGELEPKDMLRIRYAAERVCRRLQGGQGEAATTRKLEEINADLHYVEDKLTTMQGQLEDFINMVSDTGGGSPTLRAITRRAGICT